MTGNVGEVLTYVLSLLAEAQAASRTAVFIQAGPGGPAIFSMRPVTCPTRKGSLRDSAALRVLARLSAPLDVSAASLPRAKDG